MNIKDIIKQMKEMSDGDLEDIRDESTKILNSRVSSDIDSILSRIESILFAYKKLDLSNCTNVSDCRNILNDLFSEFGGYCDIEYWLECSSDYEDSDMIREYDLRDMIGKFLNEEIISLDLDVLSSGILRYNLDSYAHVKNKIIHDYIDNPDRFGRYQVIDASTIFEELIELDNKIDIDTLVNKLNIVKYMYDEEIESVTKDW